MAYSNTNPTLGTLVGNIRQEKALISTATTAGQTLLLLFGDLTSAPIVLRGVNESVSFNLGGTTYLGGNFNMFIEYTEE